MKHSIISMNVSMPKTGERMDEMLRWKLRCRYCGAEFHREAVSMEELRRYIRGQANCSYNSTPHVFNKDQAEYYEVSLADVTGGKEYGWTRLANS